MDLMSFTQSLSTYYGLDWLSVGLGLAGFYLITEKKRVGFVLTAVSVIFAAVVASVAGQYGFLVANISSCVLAIRGYLRWSVSDTESEIGPK